MSYQGTLHKAADTIEPRMQRAFFKSVRTMREKIDIEALAIAIEEKIIAKALKAIGENKVAETLDPLGGITRDAFIKGGKAAARVLK